MTFFKKNFRLYWFPASLAVLFLLAVILGAVFPNRQTLRASQQSLVSRSADLSKSAKQAIEALEKEPTQEAFDKAQKALDKVLDRTDRANFQKRMDQVAALLQVETAAEQAVQTMEAGPSDTSIAQAQEAVDKMAIEAHKAPLQERIEAAKAALENAKKEAAKQQQKRSSSSSSSQSSSSNYSVPSSQTVPGAGTIYGGPYYQAPSPGIEEVPTVPGSSNSVPEPSPTEPTSSQE